MPGPLPHYSLKDCHFARSLCCKDRPVASLSDELIFKIQARLPLSILPVSSLTPGCVRGLPAGLLQPLSVPLPWH